MNLLFLALLAQVHLSLQHLTYQDLSQSVVTLEGRTAWGQGALALHLKDDGFLRRHRDRWEGSWRLTAYPLRFRWSHLRERSRGHRSRQTTGEVWGRWHRGAWQLEPGFLAQRFVTYPGVRHDYGPLLRTRGSLLRGQVEVHLRYTSLFQRTSLSWTREGRLRGRLHLLDFRYPLSREREHQREARMEMNGHLGGPAGLAEAWAGVTGEYRRFRWDQVRSGNLLQGFLRLEIHRGGRRAGVEVRRQVFQFERFEGLSLSREHTLYAETHEATHLGEVEATLRLSLQRRDPPGVFAFNRRDRRMLRAETRWILPPWGTLRWNLHFLGKLADEVFLHPTRSVYTRQDQTYRLTAAVEAPRWRYTTEIAALYSLYRFAPDRNLLLRYLLSRLEVPAVWWNLRLQIRWQQHGTYQEVPDDGQWYFFLRQETLEGRARMRVHTLTALGHRLWILGELLDRHERAAGGDFRRRQQERAAGVQIEGNRFSLELKRVQRNRETPFWAANLTWSLMW